MANADVYDFPSDTESDFEGFTLEEINGLERDREIQLDDSDIDISSVSSVDSDDSAVFEYVNRNVEEPVWSKNNYREVNVPIFREDEGPKLPNNFDVEAATPLEYFQLLLTKDALELVLNNTNKYSRWKQDQEARQELPPWKKQLTMDELQAFIAINIVMGINQLPSYSLYWSKSPFVGNAAIKKTMSKHRYEAISEFLHISDREQEAPRNTREYDRIGKIRPLLDEVCPNFSKFNLPSKDQTIDEGTCWFFFVELLYFLLSIVTHMDKIARRAKYFNCFPFSF